MDLEIKARIRERDAYQCVVCGMGQATHKQRYGRILAVRRLNPKSYYTLDGCVTLCIVCHEAVHGKGAWAWIARHYRDDEGEVARLVRSSADCDEKEEYTWLRREQWGMRLRELRQRWGRGSRASLPKLARATGMPEKTLRDWEAGRDWPQLPEAARLAKALGIALDDLWREYDPGDWCLKSARERSDARALAFLARAPREGESLALGTMLIREVVARLKQKREQAWAGAHAARTAPPGISGVGL